MGIANQQHIKNLSALTVAAAAIHDGAKSSWPDHAFPVECHAPATATTKPICPARQQPELHGRATATTAHAGATVAPASPVTIRNQPRSDQCDTLTAILWWNGRRQHAQLDTGSAHAASVRPDACSDLAVRAPGRDVNERDGRATHATCADAGANAATTAGPGQ